MDASENTNNNNRSMLAQTLDIEMLSRKEKSVITRAQLVAIVGKILFHIPKVKGLIYRLYVVPSFNRHLKEALEYNYRMLGLVEYFESVDKPTITDFYLDSEKKLSHIKQFYYKIESVNFFYSGKSRRLMDDLLLSEYQINNRLAKYYFQQVQQEHDPADQQLYEIADKLTKSVFLHERTA